MKTINYDYIIKELKSKRAISALSVFSLVGFVVPFIPFLVMRAIDLNSLISFVFLFLIFGLPFGCFIGMRNILNVIGVRREIRKGNYHLSQDTIVDMKVSKNGRASDMDDSYCKLYLEKYSADKKSTVSVFASVYRKLRIGDNCILVFCRSEKYPVLVFPGNEYILDSSLLDKVKK